MRYFNCFRNSSFRRAITLVLLSTIATQPVANACDICGGGVGSSYMGLLPEFRKKIIGLRYRSNTLRTHISPSGGNSYLTTQESFYITELWTAWNFGNKCKVLANIPYNHLTKENQGSTISKSGFGDPSIHFFYQVLKHNRNIGKKEQTVINNALWVGLGVKAPLGQYEKQVSSGATSSINTFQLGTGSTDILAKLIYDASINNSGINITANYKWNTKNVTGYIYGNNFSVGSQFYQKIQLTKSINLAPNAGFTYEHAAKDMDNKFRLDASGGKLLLSTIGIEMSSNKWAWGGSFQKPLRENLANGSVQAGSRMMCHVAFLF